MDAYLESLVLKNDEQAVESAEIAAVDSTVVEEDVNLDVAEAETITEASEPIVEAAIEEPKKEEPAKKEEPKKEEKAKKEEKVEVTPAKKEQYAEGEVITLTNPIRVYKTPDIKQISKNVIGNVVYLGKIGDFTIINYMRHGFGMVKAYTLDSLK